MDWFTRLVLRCLGWKCKPGLDANGNKYEAWVRKSKYAYFHVYHEATGYRKVIRP